MWNKFRNNLVEKPATGIDITTDELISLRRYVDHKTLQADTKRLITPGQKRTRHLGRGIEFAATREYQAGDDIRSMAWRLTAKSMKPHIKVYLEEKERPVWLGVDLSPDMFFGTRRMFKSVASIKQASLLGWKYLLQRERVGAVIAATQGTLVFPAHAGERDFLAILASLSQCSQQTPAFSEQNYLHALLQTLQQRTRAGNLIYILSDFAKFNEDNQKLIAHIAERSQVELIFIYDQFEAQAPLPHAYRVTDGEKDILFNMNSEKCRHYYQEQFQAKQNQLASFAKKHNVLLHLLRTDESTEDEYV